MSTIHEGIEADVLDTQTEVALLRAQLELHLAEAELCRAVGCMSLEEMRDGTED